MKTSKKIIKKFEGEKNHVFDSLYINIYDMNNKRRNLLNGLKNVLIIQEEHENVMEMRKQKVKTLSKIKKEMDDVNIKYQQLKKILPNVKNVISYTEKELNELDTQIENLKFGLNTNNKQIKTDENIEENMIKGMSFEDARLLAMKKRNNFHYKQPSSPTIEKKKEFTKLDRIKNNLKIIESKLSDI